MKTDFFPALREPFSALIESLRGRPVAVLGHVRPDGDCIGSQVALTRMLCALGIDAVALNRDPVPETLAFSVEGTPWVQPEDARLEERTAITADCAGHNRLGDAIRERVPHVAGNIDHHISNTCYGELNLIDGEASATAEILAGLFLDLELPLDALTAQALYIGIVTDTGQFRFPATAARTFAIAEKLVQAGARPSEIAERLYENESPAKMALLGRFLDSFRFHCGGRACVGLLKRTDFEATGARDEDTEGLVDFARTMKGVEIGVLVEERPGSLKGSFRAKDPLHRVDQLAAEFNGGGHACAAGFNLTESVDSFLPRLAARLESHFSECGEVRPA